MNAIYKDFCLCVSFIHEVLLGQCCMEKVIVFIQKSFKSENFGFLSDIMLIKFMIKHKAILIVTLIDYKYWSCS